MQTHSRNDVKLHKWIEYKDFAKSNYKIILMCFSIIQTNCFLYLGVFKNNYINK